MKNPERLAKDFDAPGSALLRSARQYRVSDLARQRALATMGLAASVTTTAASKAAGAGAATGAKVWLFASMVAAAGGYFLLAPKSRPTRTAAASARPSASVQVPIQAIQFAAAAHSSSASGTLGPSGAAVLTAAPSATTIGGPRRDARSRRPVPEDLTAELGALDTISQAIRRGDGPAALAQLDAYTRAFPHGSLDMEASVLHVEALERAGRHAEAASHARAFVSKHPASPLAERMRQIAGI